MKQELNPAVPESGSHKTGVAAEAAPPDRKDSEKEEKEGDGKDGEVKATAEGTASEVEGEVKQNGESVSATEGQGEGAVATSEDEEVKSKEESSQTAEGKEVKVEYIPLDLASFQSTKECVRIFKERDLPLHILVNNAAVCWIPFSEDYEMILFVYSSWRSLGYGGWGGWGVGGLGDISLTPPNAYCPYLMLSPHPQIISNIV